MGQSHSVSFLLGASTGAVLQATEAAAAAIGNITDAINLAATLVQWIV